MVFPFENSKTEHYHWILNKQINLGAKFQLKLTISIFWTKSSQRCYFQSKMEKVNITIEFYIFVFFFVPNFTSNKQKHNDWVLHIRISVGTKFQLKLTILDFWTNFNLKGYIRSKTETVKTTTEFSILAFAMIPNFSLNW